MEIRILNADPMFDYKYACCITKNKIIKKISRPENELEYWIKQICTEHSTLRFIEFVITDIVPKSCRDQLIRATKGNPQPICASSRPDWTGEERSNNPYEMKLFCEKYTPESFLALCRQRLCFKTEKKTRDIVVSWLVNMKEHEDPLIRAIAHCAEPQCMYKGGYCSELEPCGLCSQTKAEKIIATII